MICIVWETPVAEPANAFQAYDQRTSALGCAMGEPIASLVNF